jgi:hypothetical protein
MRKKSKKSDGFGDCDVGRSDEDESSNDVTASAFRLLGMIWSSLRTAGRRAGADTDGERTDVHLDREQRYVGVALKGINLPKSLIPLVCLSVRWSS